MRNSFTSYWGLFTDSRRPLSLRSWSRWEEAETNTRTTQDAVFVSLHLGKFLDVPLYARAVQSVKRTLILTSFHCDLLYYRRVARS